MQDTSARSLAASDDCGFKDVGITFVQQASKIVAFSNFGRRHGE
jgi:hypothetical protein